MANHTEKQMEIEMEIGALENCIRTITYLMVLDSSSNYDVIGNLKHTSNGISTQRGRRSSD